MYECNDMLYPDFFMEWIWIHVSHVKSDMLDPRCVWGEGEWRLEVVSLLCMSKKDMFDPHCVGMEWIHVSVYVCVSVFDRGQGVSVYREGEWDC